MNAKWDILLKLADRAGGYITVQLAEKEGVNRMDLSKYTEEGLLMRVGRGRYIIPDTDYDRYALLQSRSEKAVYSYGTALFLWHVVDHEPEYIDVTVPQGTNVSRIKKDNPNVNFHYVQPEIYDLGKTEAVSSFGNRIVLYDQERSICDLIKARGHVDSNFYVQGIKSYFAGSIQKEKLLDYGGMVGVEDQIRMYMEVLT